MSFAVKLNNLISKLEINHVFLKSSNINTELHPYLIKPDKTDVSVQEDVRWTFSGDKKILFCEVIRRMAGVTKLEGDVSKNSLTIDVTLAVQYTVSELDNEIDENLINVFCETNAVYNSYPYYREYIQSTCSRLGMYPIVVPFLKPFTVKQIQERYEQLANSQSVKE